MDSLKNFAEGVSNKPSNSNQQQSNTAGSGQQDYLDKGTVADYISLGEANADLYT